MMHRLRLTILCLIACVGLAWGQLNTDRLLSIGRNALYFEDYVLSIQYFNQVIKAKPFLTDPYFYRAIAKIELDDYTGAEKDLDIVISRNPFIPMAYYARAYTYKRQERWQEAETDLDKALEYSPDNFIYMLNRVEVYEENGKYDLALADLDYLIKKNEKSVDLQFERGRVLFEMNDTIGALLNFDNLCRVDSTNSEAWSARGLMYLINDDNEIALQSYDKAVRLNSKNPSTYINRGILNYKRKNYRLALSDYDRAIELDTANLHARFNRSLLRNEVGDYHTALSDLDYIIANDADFNEAIYQRALINTHLGNVDEAIDDYSTIIGRYPRFIPAYYARGSVYEMIGKDKKAYLDFQQAARIREEQRRNPNGDQSQIDTLDVSVKVATDDRNLIKNRAKLFAMNGNGSSDISSLRGAIQNMDINLENEQNIQISYYKKQQEGLLDKEYSHPLVVDFNRREMLPKIYLVPNEVSLTEGMIKYHFSSIERLSAAIVDNPVNADLYLARAYDHALVQDFASAVEDFSKAIFYGEDMTLAYFARANVRYKNLVATISRDMADSQNVASGSALGGSKDIKSVEKRYSYDYEMIMRDYDKVIEYAPDFAYVWYNRANLLAELKDYKTAINNYTKAIELKADFGEAYYNRGLTHIYLGEEEKGIDDLSKAGELGIYKAYVALKKIRE